MSLLPFVGGYDRVEYDFVVDETSHDVAVYENIGQRVIDDLVEYLSKNYNNVTISDDIFSNDAIASYLIASDEFHGIKVGTAKTSSTYTLENSSFEIVPFVSRDEAVSTDSDAIKFPYIAVINSDGTEAEDIPGSIIKIINKYPPYKIINFE